MTELVLTLIGPDHPGIVESVSEVVVANGGKLFRAHVRVVVPESVEVGTVRQALERLAADLMVEIRLVESLGAAA